MSRTVGVPVKLLLEAQGHIVSVELSCGSLIHGKLMEAEDNMNMQIFNVMHTARDGRVSHLQRVYIRGSNVRFIIVPEILKHAPMFRRRLEKGKGAGTARGRAVVMGAQAGRYRQQHNGIRNSSFHERTQQGRVYTTNKL